MVQEDDMASAKRAEEKNSPKYFYATFKTP